jgi:hypothetical protein
VPTFSIVRDRVEARLRMTELPQFSIILETDPHRLGVIQPALKTFGQWLSMNARVVDVWVEVDPPTLVIRTGIEVQLMPPIETMSLTQ